MVVFLLVKQSKQPIYKQKNMHVLLWLFNKGKLIIFHTKLFVFLNIGTFTLYLFLEKVPEEKVSVFACMFFNFVVVKQSVLFEKHTITIKNIQTDCLLTYGTFSQKIFIEKSTSFYMHFFLFSDSKTTIFICKTIINAYKTYIYYKKTHKLIVFLFF